MMENWKAITPDLLRAPENAPVIEELKRIADRRPASTAVVLLLRYGDDETVKRSLMQLRAQSPRARGSADRDLSLAANPATIQLIEHDLNKDESPKMIFFEDVAVAPTSMAAASVIKATILESPVFPPEVKEWAKRLPKVSVGLRDGVRAWWKVNKAAIERGDYQAVTPVEPGTDAAVAKPDDTATPAPATPAPIATPAASSQPVTPVAQTPASPAERKSPVWPWLVGIAALIAIIAVVLKRRA